jgi:hypothetical protein
VRAAIGAMLEQPLDQLHRAVTRGATC